MKIKAEKRETRKAEKGSTPEGVDPDEDPDLAGMVAGPQPIVEQ